MKGNMGTVTFLLLLGGLTLTTAVTNVQRCLGKRDEQQCLYCCRRLSGREKDLCERRCPDLSKAIELLLECPKNPSTCPTCCVQALLQLSYRPELLKTCIKTCISAVILNTLG